jgi:hypothetical protein
MIRQLGVDLKQPTERDDPNLTVQFISESLRTLVSFAFFLNVRSDQLRTEKNKISDIFLGCAV